MVVVDRGVFPQGMRGKDRAAGLRAFSVAAQRFIPAAMEAYVRPDDSSSDGQAAAVRACGAWTVETARDVLAEIGRLGGAEASNTVDASGLTALDTAGAVLLRQLAGPEGEIAHASDVHRSLLDAVGAVPLAEPIPADEAGLLRGIVTSLGESVSRMYRQAHRLLGMTGAVIAELGWLALRPWHFPLTSTVYHRDRTGLQATPIIALISFLIGAIIAQQGAFQLRYFGAEIFVIDLVGILMLREIGVLITSIMVAGRSGSSYTAEIGSMRMREEVDALSVMGLNPIRVLVVPRVVALMIALPLLTVISIVSGIFGAALVCLVYIDLPLGVFFDRIQDAVTLSYVFVGLVKAPFMAAIIGIVAANEGAQVAGSAESLGHHTTASVVKAIFLVIVLDGVFAMFFASIGV